MKALLIGGTGTISMVVTELARERGWGVALLNRGFKPVPEGMESVAADIHNEEAAARIVEGRTYNVMAQLIAYGAEDVERDIRLFQGRTRQYTSISSASTYQKPVADCSITESTPLINPCWEYSRKKIDAEEVLTVAYRRNGFPVTIMRLSHTHDSKKPPVAIHDDKGNWQILKRILEGKSTIIPGDGTSLWTLTHSTDFVRGYVGLMGNPHAIGNAYHITSDESVTWNQTYETLAETLDRPLNAPHVASDFLAEHEKEYDSEGQFLGDKACTVLFDNTKIKRTVSDFVCRVSMAEGARSSVRYIMDHPESQTPDPQLDAWCGRVVGAWKAADEASGKQGSIGKQSDVSAGKVGKRQEIRDKWTGVHGVCAMKK